MTPALRAGVTGFPGPFRLHSGLAGCRARPGNPPRLTPRQMSAAAASGWHGSSQIARRPGSCEGTVPTHLVGSYGKLAVSSRTAPSPAPSPAWPQSRGEDPGSE